MKLNSLNRYFFLLKLEKNNINYFFKKEGQIGNMFIINFYNENNIASLKKKSQIWWNNRIILHIFKFFTEGDFLLNCPKFLFDDINFVLITLFLLNFTLFKASLLWASRRPKIASDTFSNIKFCFVDFSWNLLKKKKSCLTT